jgi:hypothetical protein
LERRRPAGKEAAKMAALPGPVVIYWLSKESGENMFATILITKI